MAEETNLELLMKIRADASQAREATQALKSDIASVAGAQVAANKTMAESGTANRTVAEALKSQGVAAKDVAAAYKQLGFSGGAAAKEIAVAFGQTGVAAEAAGAAAQRGAGMMNTAFLKSYATTQLLGREIGVGIPFSVARLASKLEFLQPIMSGAFSAAIVVFAGEAILALIPKIEAAAQAMSGWGKEAQKAFAEIAKGANEALTKFGGLTTAAKIATGHILIAQTEARIEADEAIRSLERETTGWAGLKKEVLGIADLFTGKAMSELTVGRTPGIISYIADKKAVFKANADAMQQYNLLQKQLQELTRLEKEASEEEKKAAHKRVAAVKTYSDALEGMLQRQKEALQSFTDSNLPALQQINLAYRRQVDAATKAIFADRQLLAQKKITLGEEKREEQEYTDFLTTAIELREAKLDYELGRLRTRIQKITDEIEQKRTEAQTKLAKEIAAQAPQGPQLDIFSPQAAGMGGVFERMAQQAVPGLTRIQKGLFAVKDAMAQTQTPLQASWQGFQNLSSATAQAGLHAILYGENVGKAMKAAAKAVLESVAEQAAVQAIFSLATYFIDMATYQFQAAAQALTASEMFGVVAAMAGGGLAAMSGGRRSSSVGGGSASAGVGGGSGGAGGSGGVAPTLAGGAQFAPSGGGLVVAIMGNEEAGQWLATTLNRAVSQQGVQLVASDSQRSAKVGQ